MRPGSRASGASVLGAALSRLTPGAALAVFAFANIVVLNLVLVPVVRSSIRATSVGVFADRFLRFRTSGDSAGAMKPAYEHVVDGRPDGLYEDVFERQKIKFQYPPTSLLPWFALRSRPGEALLSFAGISFDRALILISWIAVFVTVGFTTAIFRVSWRQTVEEGTSRSPGPLATGAVFLLALFFYPVLRGFSLGQVQVWIGAAFAAAFWCWLVGRRFLAGVLLALCSMMKPQLALVFLLGLLRAEWPLCAGFLVTAAAGVGLSLVYSRPSDYLDYLRVLHEIARHGEAFYPNQSVNGLLHRLLFSGDSGRWNRNSYAPDQPVVYAGTVVSSLCLIAAALWVRRRPTGIGRGADFALAALVSTMASPIAWEHHYGILAPIFAFLLPPLWRFRPAGRWTMPVLAASYVLASNFIGVANRLRKIPVANVLQSYLLAAALAVGALLLLLRRLDPPVAPGWESRA